MTATDYAWPDIAGRLRAAEAELARMRAGINALCDDAEKVSAWSAVVAVPKLRRVAGA